MSMQNPLNKIIMEEIGLTITRDNVVIDQDTRLPLVINENKLMKYSSQKNVPVGVQEEVFDPATNRDQMNKVFTYFINKIDGEGVPVDMYYDIHNGSSLELKSEGTVYTTADYNNDQLRYVDMMKQLNGSQDIDDLKKMDDKKPKSTSTRRPTKKRKIDFSK